MEKLECYIEKGINSNVSSSKCSLLLHVKDENSWNISTVLSDYFLRISEEGKEWDQETDLIQIFMQGSPHMFVCANGGNSDSFYGSEFIWVNQKNESIQ